MKTGIAVATAAVALATVPGILPTADAGTTTTFEATNANIRCDPPNPGWMTRADARYVKNNLGGIIGTQENCDHYPDSTNPPVQQIILDVLGPDWGHYIPAKGGVNTGPHEVPIFWYQPTWRLRDHGYMWIAPGRAATWVRLKNRATGLNVIRVNTHWTNGAWKDGGDPDRQAQWYGCQRNTTQLVGDLHARYPHAPIIIGGDFNSADKTNAEILPPGDFTFDINVEHQGLAHYNQPPVTTTDTRHALPADEGGPLHTDHPAVNATYTVTP